MFSNKFHPIEIAVFTGVFVILCIAVYMHYTAKPGYTELTSYTVIPDELKECKVFNLRSVNNSSINVIKCPNATTTTNEVVSVGKTKKIVTNIVIDN